LKGGDGALYGTTASGGFGSGTVFKLRKDGNGNFTIHTILKNFGGSDGNYPIASLLEGSDGALYGTTSEGGSNGHGIVFRLRKDGNGNYTQYTIVRDFIYFDGADPWASLMQGSDGALYATTISGGMGHGVAFKLSTDGAGNYSIYTDLRYFMIINGATPYASLMEGSDGALYGTTYGGGSGGSGTVFELTKDGSGNFTIYTVLKSFTGGDGGSPSAGLMEGADGVLYGTTYQGGGGGYGTVFKLNKDGTGNYTAHNVMKNFTGIDGSYPQAGLVAASDGALYGTTYWGGSGGYGIVFKIGCSSGWYLIRQPRWILAAAQSCQSACSAP